MPSTIPQEAIDEITETVGVVQSAVVFIEGEAARQTAAIEAALANGATEAQLAPLRENVALLKGEKTRLANAIAANPRA